MLSYSVILSYHLSLKNCSIQKHFRTELQNCSCISWQQPSCSPNGCPFLLAPPVSLSVSKYPAYPGRKAQSGSHLQRQTTPPPLRSSNRQNHSKIPRRTLPGRSTNWSTANSRHVSHRGEEPRQWRAPPSPATAFTPTRPPATPSSRSMMTARATTTRWTRPRRRRRGTPPDGRSGTGGGRRCRS